MDGNMNDFDYHMMMYGEVFTDKDGKVIHPDRIKRPNTKELRMEKLSKTLQDFDRKVKKERVTEKYNDRMSERLQKVNGSGKKPVYRTERDYLRAIVKRENNNGK